MKSIQSLFESKIAKRSTSIANVINENLSHSGTVFEGLMVDNKAEFFENLGFSSESVNEALIQLSIGKENQFGNVVILAGGAGSGKGFTLSNLIDIQGKVLDVDALKQNVLDNAKLREKIQKEKGIDISQFDLRNPSDVGKLHLLIANDMGLDERRENALFASIMSAHPERKPNLVFDVTLKDMKKFHEIMGHCEMLGYDKKKIHIVWVMNDVDMAIQQNATRSRVVPHEILLKTHQGASQTVADILKWDEGVKGKMDGKIVISFAKAGVDVIAVKGEEQENSQFVRLDKKGRVKKEKPVYIKQANYWIVKEQGKSPKKWEDIEEQIKRTVQEYAKTAGGDVAWMD